MRFETSPAVDAVGLSFRLTLGVLVARRVFFVFFVMRPAPLDSAPTPQRIESSDAAAVVSPAGSRAANQTAPAPLRRGRVLGHGTSDEEMSSSHPLFSDPVVGM